MPEVTEFPPTRLIGQSAVRKSTTEKIDAALAVVAMWGALLPRFLEKDNARPAAGMVDPKIAPIT